MSEMSDRQILVAVVGGDLEAFAKLLQKPPAIIDGLSDSLSDLTVTRESVLRVLLALQRRAAYPVLIQQWASFIRRGYFGTLEGHRSPIEIQYEPSAEDQIVEILARLDELGDMVDGDITDAELAQMIQSLCDCS
jgi:hypothetical protein